MSKKIFLNITLFFNFLCVQPLINAAEGTNNDYSDHEEEYDEATEQSFTDNACSDDEDDTDDQQLHKKPRIQNLTCNLCKKNFATSNNLKRHQGTHTGERPHSCTYDGCGKSFSRFGHLKDHQRIHTGDKPFSCPYDGCGKSFSQSTHLKVHLRMHAGEKPFSCKDCTETFGTSSSLKVHLRRHTGDKPFSCKDCTKTFGTSSSLKVHQRTHTGDKPYPCKDCTNAFSTSSDLKRHQKTHKEPNLGASLTPFNNPKEPIAATINPEVWNILPITVVDELLLEDSSLTLPIIPQQHIPPVEGPLTNPEEPIAATINPEVWNILPITVVDDLLLKDSLLNDQTNVPGE